MSEIKLLPFQRKLRRCPKCLGKVKRFYCEGDGYRDCSNYGSVTQRKEHFDVFCQECGYKFYEAVKP
jgi:hypothetical protein